MDLIHNEDVLAHTKAFPGSVRSLSRVHSRLDRRRRVARRRRHRRGPVYRARASAWRSGRTAHRALQGCEPPRSGRLRDIGWPACPLAANFSLRRAVASDCSRLPGPVRPRYCGGVRLPARQRTQRGADDMAGRQSAGAPQPPGRTSGTPRATPPTAAGQPGLSPLLLTSYPDIPRRSPHHSGPRSSN